MSRYLEPDECPNCGCLTTHRPGACEAADRDEEFHFRDCGVAGGWPHPASACADRDEEDDE